MVGSMVNGGGVNVTGGCASWLQTIIRTLLMTKTARWKRGNKLFLRVMGSVRHVRLRTMWGENTDMITRIVP